MSGKDGERLHRCEALDMASENLRHAAEGLAYVSSKNKDNEAVHYLSLVVGELTEAVTNVLLHTGHEGCQHAPPTTPGDEPSQDGGE